MTRIISKKDKQPNTIVYEALIDYIEQNQNRFYVLAFSYAKNKDTALDIVQTAIYKALTSIDGLHNPNHIKTWFYRILVNTSLDELRRSCKVMPMNPADLNEDDMMYADCPKDSEHSVDVADYLDLYAALDSLEPKAQTLIKLRYFEDMKLTEIAEVLDESLSSVKSRLYRTLSKMRIQLEGEEL